MLIVHSIRETQYQNNEKKEEIRERNGRWYSVPWGNLSEVPRIICCGGVSALPSSTVCVRVLCMCMIVSPPWWWG